MSEQEKKLDEGEAPSKEERGMRLKLVMRVVGDGDSVLVGQDAKLIDMDTGEEVPCGDLKLDLPMDGVAQVNADITINDVEVVHGEWPKFKQS
jgi:hypothetical protein